MRIENNLQTQSLSANVEFMSFIEDAHMLLKKDRKEWCRVRGNVNLLFDR